MGPLTHVELGRWGEARAADYLEDLGWRVVAQNYRVGRREIDLIAVNNGVLAFVEVKTRRGEGFGPPAVAVTWKKRREIERVASVFLDRYRAALQGVRFDIIAIRTGPNGSFVLEHIEDAWRLGGP